VFVQGSSPFGRAATASRLPFEIARDIAKAIYLNPLPTAQLKASILAQNTFNWEFILTSCYVPDKLKVLKMCPRSSRCYRPSCRAKSGYTGPSGSSPG